MDTELFIKRARQLVADYSNERNDTKVEPSDVFVVWQSKVLQNNKALLSAPVSDGRYYEVTYNGDKKQIYFDAYKKELNDMVQL